MANNVRSVGGKIVTIRIADKDTKQEDTISIGELKYYLPVGKDTMINPNRDWFISTRAKILDLIHDFKISKVEEFIEYLNPDDPLWVMDNVADHTIFALLITLMEAYEDPIRLTSFQHVRKACIETLNRLYMLFSVYIDSDRYWQEYDENNKQ